MDYWLQYISKNTQLYGRDGRKMTDSKEEREVMWQEVETSTGTKFLYIDAAPITTELFINEGREAIEALQDLNLRIDNKNGDHLEFWMMQELWVDGDMLLEKYLWQAKMSHMCFG